MIKTNLTLGTKLELELYDANRDRIVPTLISQFEAILPDGSMEILSPILEGRIYPIRRGTHLNVIYEKNGNLFTFASQALDRRFEGCSSSDNAVREEQIQRRYFSGLNAQEEHIFAHSETMGKNAAILRGNKDISGG